MKKNDNNKKYSHKYYLQYLLKKKLMDFKSQIELKEILRRARSESTVEAALGDEGSGKSTAIAEEILGVPNTYYVKSGESSKSRFLDDLLLQMTGSMPYKSWEVYAKMLTITELLFNSKGNNLIVIDDAGKLGNALRGMGLLHELRDASIRNTGIVFVGLPYFKENLELEIAKAKPKKGIREFYRRFDSWNTLSPLDDQDKIEYCRIRGLHQEEIDLIVSPKGKKSLVKPVRLVYELERTVDKILKLRKFK